MSKQKFLKLSLWFTQKKYIPLILVLLVFVFIFLVYRQYGLVLDRKATSLTYWDLLAKAFLDGRLFLTNPPSTWDLTFFQGHWYVPQPPLPALLMVPLVLFLGDVDPVLFSIFFSAFNCVLLLLIYFKLSGLRWIRTSRAGMIWLVALFAFGTPAWWVGMDGRVWYVSQVLTVTFIAVAVLLALMSRSPLLVGFSLGLAILARPNVIVLWLLLFAIYIQLQLDGGGKIQIRKVIVWALQSVIPPLLAVAALLIYNHLRFQNYLDFGYGGINGDADLVAAVHTYGMFSLHYVPRNLRIMFLQLPQVLTTPPFISPSITGMSLVITTPAWVFLLRKYEKKVWILGACLSSLISLFLLAMYHNMGTAQFGYRYILDLVIPLMMLMAVKIDRKLPWLLIVLILLSIIINEFGAFWFIRYLGG